MVFYSCKYMKTDDTPNWIWKASSFTSQSTQQLSQIFPDIFHLVCLLSLRPGVIILREKPSSIKSKYKEFKSHGTYKKLNIYWFFLKKSCLPCQPYVKLSPSSWATNLCFFILVWTSQTTLWNISSKLIPVGSYLQRLCHSPCNSRFSYHW